nr:transposase [Burkholderia stabilis]
MQADAFSGYDALYRDGTVIEAGCWAHARRKFYDLYKLDSSPNCRGSTAPHWDAVCR